jgi:hypothetical protein
MIEEEGWLRQEGLSDGQSKATSTSAPPTLHRTLVAAKMKLIGARARTHPRTYAS